MAKKATVRTEMGGAFSSGGKEGCAHVGSYKPVIKVNLGEKNAAKMTPTQTGINETRPSRAGTKQFPYGKTSE